MIGLEEVWEKVGIVYRIHFEVENQQEQTEQMFALLMGWA